jgi:hypothetical protein
MTTVPRNTEFRRCQKCGQVEKEETGEIIIAGKHPDACDNAVEIWVRFWAPPDWPSAGFVELGLTVKGK